MHRLHLSALTQPRVAVKLGVTVAVVSTVAANRDRLLQFRCVGTIVHTPQCMCMHTGLHTLDACALPTQAPAQQHRH